MTVYYYDDPLFVVKAGNTEPALFALKAAQSERFGVNCEERSIKSCTDLAEALEKLELHTQVDEFGSVFVKEIDTKKKPKGMMTDSRAAHCQFIFQAIGPYGEGVFSFVEREESRYRKHRYKGDTYENITMHVAIYDPDDIKSIKKLTEQIIDRAVQLGVPEEDIIGWVKNSLVDLVMDA